MKEKVIKIVCFLLIFVFILSILSYIFAPKNNTKADGIYYETANGILGEPKDTIDVLIVGNSESYCSIIPMELWKNFGFTSYICGTPAQKLPDTLNYIYKATKNQTPKVLILEVDNVCVQSDITMPIEKIAENIFPVIEYHNRWKSLKKTDFYEPIDYTWHDYLKGYNYSDVTFVADCKEYMKYTKETMKISETNKMYVKLIKKYCEDNNIKFIMTSMPNTKNWNYKKHNSVKKFADEENIEFLDLNAAKDELKIDWNTESRDAGDHLNYAGGLKATQYLGNYLNNKQILQDHRNDETYSKEWNEDLAKYEELVEKR